MKKAMMALTMLTSLFASSHTFAAVDNAASFAPENNLNVPVGSVRSLVSEAEFNDMIDRIEDIYRPIVQSKGARLVLFNKWQDGTVNAYTKRVGNNWEIHMFGGLARFGGMTRLGIASVACHEVGHQLGGLPKKTSWWYGTGWAAAEGQSDYYATAKCMKEFLRSEDNVAALENEEIYPEITALCDGQYPNEEDAAICKRTAMAGEVLGRVLAEMSNKAQPSILTPSTLVVEQTNIAGYPSVQCRVDTYLQGALCDAPFSIEPSEEDIHQGYCARVNGDTIGTRPLCWYAPGN